MRILRLSYKPKNSHYSNDKYFFEELSKQADVYFLNINNKNPKTIQKKIDKLVLKYNFDLIYKSYMGNGFDSLNIKPLHTYGIPIVISAGDCHTRLNESRLNTISNYHKFDALIVNNKSTIESFNKYFDRKLSYIWIPWAYNPSIHKDYYLKKKWMIVIQRI